MEKITKTQDHDQDQDAFFGLILMDGISIDRPYTDREAITAAIDYVQKDIGQYEEAARSPGGRLTWTDIAEIVRNTERFLVVTGIPEKEWSELTFVADRHPVSWGSSLLSQDKENEYGLMSTHITLYREAGEWVVGNIYRDVRHRGTVLKIEGGARDWPKMLAAWRRRKDPWGWGVFLEPLTDLGEGCPIKGFVEYFSSDFATIQKSLEARDHGALYDIAEVMVGLSESEDGYDEDRKEELIEYALEWLYAYRQELMGNSLL